MQIEVQEFVISMDLFLLPMAGSNIVLGNQWLRKLGLVISDYEKPSMEFLGKDRELNGKGSLQSHKIP